MNRLIFEEDLENDIPDFIPSQCAQDPLEGFSEQFPEFSSKSRQIIKKTKNKRQEVKTSEIDQKSFMISKGRNKGHKLIQIKVIDLTSREKEDDIVLSAQYVVKDIVDEVLNDTQNVLKKISKKLCDDDCLY